MNTLSAVGIRRIFLYLDNIRELTDLLRRAHFDVPEDIVYGAVGGEASIRELLLNVALADIEVEPTMVEAAQ
jgi:hypothetical protein